MHSIAETGKKRILRGLRFSSGLLPAAWLLLPACVETLVEPPPPEPLHMESQQIPLQSGAVPRASHVEIRLHRIRALIENGFLKEAKVELTELSRDPEAEANLSEIERFDRYIEGGLLDESIHGGVVIHNTDHVGAGEVVEVSFEILNSGPRTFAVLARGGEDDYYEGSDEISLLKVRVTELLFDALGARKRTVRWLSEPLDSNVRCTSGQVTRIPWALEIEESAPYAIKLVRVEGFFFPCAAQVDRRYVPLKPFAMGSCVVRVYPSGWRDLREDVLLALRASCLSQDPQFDRHTLIVASLVPKGGEEEREAFSFLTYMSAEGSPRSRAKADAALGWLRLDLDELWKEDVPFEVRNARPKGTLDLPGRRR